MLLEDIELAVRSHRYRFSSELELQDGLEMALKQAGLSYVREAILSRSDRIDFLLGNVGVEVKIGGGISQVTRQLHRYAQLESVEALILVTSKVQLGNLPTEINGKPLKVITLLESIF